jgi:hypothetical protein
MKAKLAALSLAAALAANGFEVAPAAARARDEVKGYLGKVGFTSTDLAALEGGQVISRSETAKDTGEIVAIAAVKIRAPRDKVVGYYGEMVKYVDGKVTLGFGRFSNPPAPTDVASLSFGRDEIDALRSCRPGDCDVRLGGAGLNALHSAIDWNAPDYAEKANEFVRQSALKYVADYQQRGDEALITFDDSDQPVSLKTQWRGIVANSPYFQAYAPELEAYLVGYPTATLPGARDVIYWVKENYGALKTVVSVVHAVIYEPPSNPDFALVAQKHIYASHYYDASLAVASMAGAEESGKPVTYLVYVNRSRGGLLKESGSRRRDMLKVGGLKRTVAKDQASKAAEQTLGTIQTMLEQAYANR